MSSLLRILEVSDGGSPHQVVASKIDFPRAGQTLKSDLLEVVGWAVGRRFAIERMEVVEAGRIVSRAPMIVDRPDAAAAHAGSPQGDRVAFHLVCRGIEPGRHDLVLRAGLSNGDTRPIGRIVCTCTPRPQRPGATILAYHRVISLPSEPWSMSVSPDHFDQQLKVLRSAANPWPLRRLADAIRRDETIPPRTVAVTFDDGYFDNLANALPRLERHEIPATMFISTGFVGQPREFWWDELDRIFLQATSLPSELNLRLDGRDRRWSLEGETDWDESTVAAHAAWKAGSGIYPTVRHRIYRELWEILLDLPRETRDGIRDTLLSWASLNSAARSTHRSMTSEELLRLSQSALIDIGAHTVTHPNLNALPLQEQQQEVQSSKEFLEARLAGRILSFAYPFGQREHYSESTMKMLERVGFTNAVANHPGPVTRDSNLFALPRQVVHNLDGESFEALLGQWFSAGDAECDDQSTR